MTNFKLLLCKASHQQHETVEENEDTDLPAKIGTQSSAEKPKEDSAQKHTKKTQQVLDIIDEDDSPPSPAPRPKKTKCRMHKKKATVSAFRSGPMDRFMTGNWTGPGPVLLIR